MAMLPGEPGLFKKPATAAGEGQPVSQSRGARVNSLLAAPAQWPLHSCFRPVRAA